MEQKTPVLLSYAFRPFFLLNGIFAIVAVLIWILTLHGKGLPVVTPAWHAHEMLVGFAMAAMAGFSLTAVATWTGRPALGGAALGWLLMSWLAGRLAMLLEGWLPAVVVTVLDMAFPLLLALLLGREIVAGGSRRNYVLIVVVALMGVFNGIYHMGTGGLFADSPRLAVYLLLHAVLLLVTLIAGRIVPSFTGNWLRMQGRQRMPAGSPGVDKALLVLVLLTGIAASFFPLSRVSAGLCFATALLHAVRLGRWRGLSTTSNPLLFVLHVAYLWLPVGYALTGMAAMGWLSAPGAALHALTMGAIGTMILAVMTRVALGHTGRPLEAGRATVWAYLLLALAALSRVLGPLLDAGSIHFLDMAAAGWILAFLIFIGVYWPILTRPRN